MDSLMGTIGQIDETIWSTPAKTMDDIEAKLRFALYYTNDRDAIRLDAPDFLAAIAIEWTRIMDAERTKILS